jgi:hypothetical protein
MKQLVASQIVSLLDALIGETEPYADSTIDHGRLINQKDLFIIIDFLMNKVYKNVEYSGSPYYSAKEIGLDAVKYLKGLRDEINEELGV